jgi:Tol biopolymer transport system component
VANKILIIALLSIVVLFIGFFINQRIIRIEGQWIAYFCEIDLGDGGGSHSSDSAILLTNANQENWTRQLIRVSRPRHVHNPSWLSDNIIAFEQEPGSAIRIMYLNSLRSYTIDSESIGIQSFPTWSPNGQQIAFVRNLSDLYVYDLESSEETKLISLQTPAPPSWSPDGRYISLQQNDTIVMINVEEGTTSILLELEQGGGLSATWSPDGRTIVFGGQLDGISGLYSIDLSSNDIFLISDINGWSPAWSPDGEWIAFVARPEEYGSPNIYKIRPDGTDLQEIYTDSRCVNVQAPAWSQNLKHS